MHKRWLYGSNGKYIWLAWKLAYMLKTYRPCNSTVEFSKYEFNNKLLDDVILIRVILGVTWTQPYMCVCVCIFYINWM